MMAPADPKAPPSVGVNQPANMPPMTKTKSTMVSMIPESAIIFSLRLVFGPAGPSLGLRHASNRMVMAKATVSIRPAGTSATNSLAMERLYWIPMTISTTLGGIMTPSVPPVATEPQFSASS